MFILGEDILNVDDNDDDEDDIMTVHDIDDFHNVIILLLITISMIKIVMICCCSILENKWRCPFRDIFYLLLVPAFEKTKWSSINFATIIKRV